MLLFSSSLSKMKQIKLFARNFQYIVQTTHFNINLEVLNIKIKIEKRNLDYKLKTTLKKLLFKVLTNQKLFIFSYK